MMTNSLLNSKTEDFLLNIRIIRPEIPPGILQGLFNFIVKSDCKEIGFEKMSNRSLGISKTDKCVISTKVLVLPIEYLLYIILHEVSHQYQYKKYGKDLVLDVYLDDLDLESAALKLLSIEKIADRLAIKKLKEILKTNKLESTQPVKPRYLEVEETSQIKNHIYKIRSGVRDKNLKTIEDINNYILDSINDESI